MAQASSILDCREPAVMATAIGFVRVILNDVLGSEPRDVTADAMLVADLGADPFCDFDQIQIVLQEYGVGFDEDVFQHHMRVSDLAKIIIAGRCSHCNGAGEVIFNNSVSGDPINDQGRDCEHCAGRGTIHRAVQSAAQVPA